jgi:predicted secreted protein
MRFFIALFAALALAAPALAQPKPPAPVELENPADGTTIKVKRGGELKLVLDGAPLVQQTWEADAKVGPVLSPIGNRAVVGKSVNPADLSAGQWNIFRYRAAEPGKVTLKLDLKRAEGPPVKTVRYEVVVE